MDREDIVQALRAVDSDEDQLADLRLTIAQDLTDNTPGNDLVRPKHLRQAFEKPEAVAVLRPEGGRSLDVRGRRSGHG